jgi:hypothetical protein
MSYVGINELVVDAVIYVVIYCKPDPDGTGRVGVVKGKLYRLPEGVIPINA